MTSGGGGVITKPAPLSKRSEYPDAKQFHSGDIRSPGFNKTRSKPYRFNGKLYHVPNDRHWSVSKEIMDALAAKGRLVAVGNTLMFKRYYDDFPLTQFTNVWDDTAPSFSSEKIYVVQTNSKVVQRCMLMATNPGDLVLDPTCGSGTTAFTAEMWGRRWITCDTSQVAISLARMRLMSAVFDYYKLESEESGVCGGLQYEKMERKTKKSIAGLANGDEKEEDDDESGPQYETLYDRPLVDKNRKRVTGPFTLESASPPTVESLDTIHAKTDGDSSADKPSGLAGVHFQDNWRMALRTVGVSGRIRMGFESLEPHPPSKWIHAVGTTADAKRVAVSFGPEYGTMDTRQIQSACEEIRRVGERFDVVIFAAMQFDPAVHDEISGLNGNDAIRETYHTVDINKDLMNWNLKSPKSTKSASFWMIGQPDVGVTREGDTYVAEVRGFDYMDPKTGRMDSGNTDNIAMWSLDTDYDGRCMRPQQVFFPMSGSKGAKLYDKMLKNLRAIIDRDKLESYRETRSLPFRPGATGHRRIAVKVVDEAGRETMRALDLA